LLLFGKEDKILSVTQNRTASPSMAFSIFNILVSINMVSVCKDITVRSAHKLPQNRDIYWTISNKKASKGDKKQLKRSEISQMTASLSPAYHQLVTVTGRSYPATHPSKMFANTTV